MWSIFDLKTRARSVLSKTYWKSTLFCFAVMALLSAAGSAIGSVIGLGGSGIMTIFFVGIANSASGTMSDASTIVAILMYFLFLIFLIVFSVAFGALVSAPAMLGQNRYFMRARIGQETYQDGFFAFSSHYISIVKVLFFQLLFTFLWSLLLIIPGIIKAFEYSMIPYLMAENPSLSRQRAFEISKAMTDGEKGKMLLFGLSFIGWILLVYVTCGIGIFFLNPYIQASMAELYATFRDKALYIGAATSEELPGFYS